jgi:nitrile hydratase subunit beta
MNGGHDLGGLHGLGPVAPEANEPVFHADWERRAFALTLAMGAHRRWNLDRSRFTRENRHPVDYLSTGYYELWVKALEQLTTEEGFLRPDEIAAGHALIPPPAHARPALKAEEVAPTLARGGPSERPISAAPRFAVGDPVRVKLSTSPLHTRAPRYCRGRPGVIHALRIDEIERETRHDVIAFLTWLGEGIGPRGALHAPGHDEFRRARHLPRRADDPRGDLLIAMDACSPR